MRRMVHVVLVGVLTGCGALDADPLGLGETTPRGREACRTHVEARQALFGDLHVHTALSMDAYIADTRTTPDDAYRFAKGERIAFAPLDESGRPTRAVQLARPLDFAAVTDHAENFGPVARCTREDSPAYDTQSCRTYRGEGDGEYPTTFLETVRFVIRRMSAIETDEVCGEDGRACRDAAADPWRETQVAAESHYDRSAACSFTTFVAYEHSLSPELSKVHRNVVFRNEITLDRPIHARMETEPSQLRRRLREECIDGKPGCDVIAIPHNPNLSDGRMFRTDYPGALNVNHERRDARLRARLEPVVEMMQIKGDSECRNGLVGVRGNDPLCGFEKMRAMQEPPAPDCEGEIGSGALRGAGCVDRNDFVRYALVAGLGEARRLGVNPFRFGLMASTDEHDGTMGDVSERSYGAPGTRERTRFHTNAGGLVGVWAEENSRDAIFDALKRREVFGTSGPRIEPRLFAGFGLPADLCERTDPIAAADAAGVAMGGVLPAAPAGAAPRFLVTATRDPGSPQQPGGKLQRAQIVKAWLGEDGAYEQRVFDVAGGDASLGSVDTDSCTPDGAGHDALCGVFTDPAFDPAERAVYYARIVETPSCRWSTFVCNAMQGPDRPEGCDDPKLPKTIQERAWTSPVWYEGAGAG